MNPFNLQGKTALVTGGSRGLGRGIALGLAQAGANVLVLGRTPNPDVIEQIRTHGVRGEFVACDLGDIDSLEEQVQGILAQHGQVDILVNNAGLQSRHKAEDFPRADWDRVIGVNMTAPFFLCQALGRHMLAKGGGKIINIASLLSFQGGLTVPAYAASKGAVAQFTKSLSNEWASRGINVNCIVPGYMDTDMNVALKADGTRSRQIMERIPAGRWGTPEDMAGAAVFLASAASDYIHGAAIVVDGGWLGR
ncbi:MAG: glucose 1-dehydrogenase [Rhodocyclaceae bacterium]